MVGEALTSKERIALWHLKQEYILAAELSLTRQEIRRWLFMKWLVDTGGLSEWRAREN